MLRYKIPPEVQASLVENRPILSTGEGGKVALDHNLLELWKYAHGRTAQEIIEAYKTDFADPRTILDGLACLAEAGLLLRAGEKVPEKSISKPAGGEKVSVVIVSFNSREWLEECIPSLLGQTYSPIEIIVVDNGSKDDAFPWLEINYPEIIRLRIEPAASLAHAINQGVQSATQSGYLLFLNPDIRLESDAVAQMVGIAEKNPQTAAVAAKMRFWWAPAFLNGIGNRVGPFSWGTDNALGHLDLGQYDSWQDLPSACFAAALVCKAVWERVGPVDECFPMYYEDVEWCYRARLLGYKILAAPHAVVYHAFGARIPSGLPQPLSPGKLRNVVFGRLRFAIKIAGNYSWRFVRNYLAEDFINCSKSIATLNLTAVKAYLSGWAGLVKQLPGLFNERRKLQHSRIITSQELFNLQSDMPVTLSWHGLPELTWDLVVHHYSPLFLSGRTKHMPELDSIYRKPHLLIVSNDIVDEMMAGPGMRYLEMARALSGEALDVTLAIPSETRIQILGVQLVRYWEDRPGSLQILVENSDMALISGYMLTKFPFLATTSTRLVVDLYDPTILENLHYYLHEPIDSQQAINQREIDISNALLRIGDFFICGNERQRDFWLGFLAANGRINPLTHQADPSLRALIDVVGIGLPDRTMQPHARVLRGKHALVPEEARIILWGGGIWNWLDPLTLIQAWPQVVKSHPEARLVFLGTRHPNPTVPAHEMASKAQKLAAEIGELDRSILFFEWIAYEEREAFLREADVGVLLHPIHIETRYSIRTRVLDYIWARLPVLVTEGDVTSEWVRQYSLGAVVPEADIAAVASALNTLLSQPKAAWQPAFEPLVERFRWSEVVKPLHHYCLHGGFAPDRGRGKSIDETAWASSSLAARARFILRTSGMKALLHRVWRYLQWRLSNL